MNYPTFEDMYKNMGTGAASNAPAPQGTGGMAQGDAQMGQQDEQAPQSSPWGMMAKKQQQPAVQPVTQAPPPYGYQIDQWVEQMQGNPMQMDGGKV